MSAIMSAAIYATVATAVLASTVRRDTNDLLHSEVRRVVDPTTLKVSAYATDDCTGKAALTKTFTGGEHACQALKLPDGTTVYGYAWCDEAGQPNFWYCGAISTPCTVAYLAGECEEMSLTGAGECGNAFGVFGSAIGTCPGAV